MSLPDIFSNAGQIDSCQTRVLEDYPLLITADNTYSLHLNTVSSPSVCNAWVSALWRASDLVYARIIYLLNCRYRKLGDTCDVINLCFTQRTDRP
jgi:hypothetical protein